VYEEVHAVAFGLIHSCTRLRPLGYSEIAEEDFSPELIADLQHEYHYYRAALLGACELSSPWRSSWPPAAWRRFGHLLGW